MQLSVNGGFSEMLQRIIDTHDMPSIIKEFKEILLKTYGIRTPDGRFEKSEELSRKFAQTAAYSDLFMLLATNADEAAKFVNGLIPEDKQISPAQIAAMNEKR